MTDFQNMLMTHGVAIASYAAGAGGFAIGILIGLYGIRVIRDAFKSVGSEGQTYDISGYTQEHYDQQWAAEAQMDKDQYIDNIGEDYGYEPSDDDCPSCGGWVEKGICTKCHSEVF